MAFRIEPPVHHQHDLKQQAVFEFHANHDSDQDIDLKSTEQKRFHCPLVAIVDVDARRPC